MGQELQARRKREELRLALLYLEDEEEVPKDPAEADPELRARLDENGKLFSSRMDEVRHRDCATPFPAHATV